MNMKMILPLYLFFGSIWAEQPIEVKKIFHHRGGSLQGDSPDHIELGSLGFYFDKEPRVESSVVRKHNTTMHVLFIPNARLQSDEVRRVVQQVNDRKGLNYSIIIAEVSKPQQGLQINFTYPSNKVGLKYDHFKNIRLEKGLMVRFYNKDVIQKIQEKEKSIIATASLSSPHVYIDCGHGGIDHGAVAHAVKEKDINLSIGQKTAQLLKKNGIATSLSRDSDILVPLDTRTTQANSLKSDLYVSIHANSSVNQCAGGIETFVLCPTLFKAGDSSLSPDELKATQANFADRCSNSHKLAQLVHEKMVAQAKQHYFMNDRQIKKGAPQVLMGANMPGILVEVGFVTHPDEARFLSQKGYQESIAGGIASGILTYLNQAGQLQLPSQCFYL